MLQRQVSLTLPGKAADIGALDIRILSLVLGAPRTVILLLTGKRSCSFPTVTSSMFVLQ